MAPEDFQYLKQLILETFPQETAEVLYLPDPNNSATPLGRLYSFYGYWRRRCVKFGIIEKLRQRQQNQQDSFHPVSYEASEAHEEIKVCGGPWEKIEAIWLSSSECRIELLQQCKTFDDYINTYPCLFDPRGKFLISHDGIVKMVSLGWNSTFSFVNILRNVPGLLKKNLKNIPKKFRGILKLIEDANNPRDLKALLAISMLPFCIKPARKRERQEENGGSDGENQEPNTTAIESPRHGSFLNFIPIFKNLEEAKAFARVRKRQVYPFGYIILSEFPIRLSFFVQLGDTWWNYENPVDGFDSLVKFFFGMDIKFTPGAAPLYWVVQNAVYGLINENTQRQYATTGASELLTFIMKEN